MNSRKFSVQFPAKLITPVATGGVILLLLLLYDQWFSMKFLNPVFWHPYVLVGSCIVCLILGAVALLWGRPSTLARTCLLIGTMAVLAFPLLLPAIYGEYRPCAQPASGYEMRWVTRPQNGMESAFKSALRDHESDGCTYTLYGWSADNALYYGSSCQLGYWRYDARQDTGPERVWSIPQAVKDVSSVNTMETTAGGGTMAYNPEPSKGFDPATQYPVHVHENVTSPDREWVAAAISDFYGPHDVVVFHAKD